MFTGVGGFELGLQDKKNLQSRTRSTSHLFNRGNRSNNEGDARKNNKNFRCVGFSEIDKYSNELLKQKFPEVKNYSKKTS